ncbi:MAG: sigma-70 family RNA polymerase sigma factor [Spirochaetota bacterium]
MRFQIAGNGAPVSKREAQVIDRHRAKLEKILASFHPDALTLRLSLRKPDRRNRVRARLMLKVPGSSLFAEREGRNAPAVLNEAFGALIDEAQRYADQRKRKPSYTRRRPGIREALGEPGSSEDLVRVAREAFFSYVDENISRLYTYALRELGFLVQQGVFRPGEISVGDVLDEAVVETARNLGEELGSGEAQRSLFRKIKNVLLREAAGRSSRPAVPLEQPVRPPDLDQELYEYYQPDAVIRMEDLVQDQSAVSPEQRVELEALEEEARKALSALPRQQRDAFILSAEEGFSWEEIAMIQGRSPQEVREDAERTRGFLRERLTGGA